MENVRNRTNIKFYTSKEQILKNSSKINAKTTMFNDNLAAITFNKYIVTFNKPIYVGAQILDLSKYLMYQFHYEYMKPKFPKQKLCYMDTDSFVYYIETQDFYKEIKDDVYRWFDTSKYTFSKGGIETNVNKKVIGKFKDETGDNIVSHFVALRSKLYSYYCNNDIKNTVNKVKGVKRCVKDNEITFVDLHNTLLTRSQQTRTITRFHHKGHNIYTIEEGKVALDANDDKRVLLNDHISTLGLGNYRLNVN